MTPRLRASTDALADLVATGFAACASSKLYRAWSVRSKSSLRDRQRMAGPKLNLRQKERIRAAQARADAPAPSRAMR